MIEKVSRWSAIACSAIALAIFAIWIVSGMHGVENLASELVTPITKFLTAIDQKVFFASQLTLAIGALTGTVAALLSLTLLLRGTSIPAARQLGAAMGWFAFFVAVQLIASSTAPLVSYMPESRGSQMLLDGVCFALYVTATYAFLQFWRIYPRTTTVEERAKFNHEFNEQQRKEVTWLGRKTYAWVDRIFSDPKWKRKNEAVSQRMYEFIFGRKFLIVLLTVSAITSLLWRPVPIKGINVGLILFAIAIYTWFVFVMPGVTMSIKLHRLLGNAEERRKVEWVNAAFMINFVALSLMLIPILVLCVVAFIDPAWVDKLYLLWIIGIGLYLSIATAPLLFIVALALSILYRGTLDPRLVLGKFTLWGVLGMLLTFGFVLIERAVALKVVQWFELPPETGLIAAGAIVAATFQPIRKNAEKWTETWVAKMMPASLLAAGARKEGAVVVTDISGYTAMSARDESSALVASALVQKAAKQVAEDHEGAFVKSTGDGAILHFHTADEAMRAITELHVAVGLGAVALKIDGLKLHSGAHWGEFVVGRDGDIYGQTVNVAARIADWAKAGEIAVSQSLAAHLEQAKVALLPGGAQQFKNVPEPIECLKFSPVQPQILQP